MDSRLEWHAHVDYLNKKLRSRLYCLRKMKKFQVDNKILQLFYNAVIESVWNYCISCWGGNITGGDVNRIRAHIKQCQDMTCENLKTFHKSYYGAIFKKFTKIMGDNTHALHGTFANATSPRSSIMILPYAKTNRHKQSFVPQAMRQYNTNYQRH